ncbi:uncharacterized protein LOC130357742 [Hyla sarda]|uniref:uncharacterized protein LOC130357742 n=1 Tax=Hyla sarda TaxID=327740 RepID=UPI0024C28199|nr:uncharacterized protein LOC130357742 [Hyla sarda]
MMTSEPTTDTVIPINTFSYTADDVNRIRSEISGDASFLHTPSLVDLQRQYTNETKRLSALNLHIVTLNEYLKFNRIPRGLRFQPSENAYAHDLDYRSKYELISNKYSFDIMLLNLEFLQKDSKETQLRIDTIVTSLRSLCLEDDFGKLIDKQDKFLSKFKTDQETMKRHKWHRDNHDYSTGRVYTWGNQYSQKKFRRQKDTDTDSKNTFFDSKNVVQNNSDFLGIESRPKEDPPEGAGDAIENSGRTRAQRNPKTQQAKLPFKKK